MTTELAIIVLGSSSIASTLLALYFWNQLNIEKSKMTFKLKIIEKQDRLISKQEDLINDLKNSNDIRESIIKKFADAMKL